MRIAAIAGTDLETSFGRSVFHRSQATELIRKQLQAVSPGIQLRCGKILKNVNPKKE